MTTTTLEPYSLYISRPELEAEVTTWLENPQPEYRLCSLIGPVGMGKSWFLRYFVKPQYAARDDYLVLWLDLSQKLDEDKTTPVFQLPAERDDWLQKTVDQVANEPRFQGLIIPYDRTVSWAAMWETFIRNVCRLPELQLVLLVNGLDELKEERTRWFVEDQLIAPAIALPCARVMVTRRDEWGLNHPFLRMNEMIITMKPLTNEEREFLMNHLLEQLKGNPTQVNALAQAVAFVDTLTVPDEHKLAQADERLRPFLSGNPFVNNYLLCNWLAKEENPDREVVKASIKQLATRAGVTEEATQRLLDNWSSDRNLDQAGKDSFPLNAPWVEELLRTGLAYLPPRRSAAEVHPSLRMDVEPMTSG